MTAPERIWAIETDFGEFWWSKQKYDGGTEYTRADLAAVPAQVQPDPRDEVIARLVEAVDALEMWDAARGYPVPYRIRDPLRTALAAAKAVQHG